MEDLVTIKSKGAAESITTSKVFSLSPRFQTIPFADAFEDACSACPSGFVGIGAAVCSQPRKRSHADWFHHYGNDVFGIGLNVLETRID
jgi:hypothetical protein